MADKIENYHSTKAGERRERLKRIDFIMPRNVADAFEELKRAGERDTPALNRLILEARDVLAARKKM